MRLGVPTIKPNWASRVTKEVQFGLLSVHPFESDNHITMMTYVMMKEPEVIENLISLDDKTAELLRLMLDKKFRQSFHHEIYR